MTFGPGTWLIFGIIGLPVYAVLLGWLFGRPRDGRTLALGFGLLVGLTIALWAGMFVLQLVVDLVFF